MRLCFNFGNQYKHPDLWLRRIVGGVKLFIMNIHDTVGEIINKKLIFIMDKIVATCIRR